MIRLQKSNKKQVNIYKDEIPYKELKKRTCPYCGGEHLMKAYDNGINGNNVPEPKGKVDCVHQRGKAVQIF